LRKCLENEIKFRLICFANLNYPHRGLHYPILKKQNLIFEFFDFQIDFILRKNSKSF